MATGPSGQRRNMTQARLPSCLTHPDVRSATEPPKHPYARFRGPRCPDGGPREDGVVRVEGMFVRRTRCERSSSDPIA